MNLDILNVDNRIRENFNQEKKSLPEYQIELASLKDINVKSLSPGTKIYIIRRIKTLENKVYDITNDINLGFYTVESIPLLERYKNILKQPQKMSFNKKINIENPEKKKIINEYFYVAGKYANLKIVFNNTIDKKVVCETCKNSKNFHIEENSYICQICGTIQETEVHSTSYSDIDRVNMSAKYSYDRKGHFRDTMYIYQAKEKFQIPNKVYENITKKLISHGLLEGDKNTPKEKRFNKVTRSHILSFLKETGDDRLYEHSFLIHWELTGQKRNDISYLEEKLMADFNTLVQLYFLIYKNENQVDRNSFINTQHVFYQLLLKHKHPCQKEDFSLLKTIDRVLFHDTTIEDLFRILNWPYTSLF